MSNRVVTSELVTDYMAQQKRFTSGDLMAEFHITQEQVAGYLANRSGAGLIERDDPAYDSDDLSRWVFVGKGKRQEPKNGTRTPEKVLVQNITVHNNGQSKPQELGATLMHLVQTHGPHEVRKRLAAVEIVLGCSA